MASRLRRSRACMPSILPRLEATWASFSRLQGKAGTQRRTTVEVACARGTQSRLREMRAPLPLPPELRKTNISQWKCLHFEEPLQYRGFTDVLISRLSCKSFTETLFSHVQATGRDIWGSRDQVTSSESGALMFGRRRRHDKHSSKQT